MEDLSDPAKRAGVGARSEVRDDARLEEQVKDWLRYGEDLGLGPYYRDRPPLHAIAESAAAPTESRGVATSSPISAQAPPQWPQRLPVVRPLLP